MNPKIKNKQLFNRIKYWLGYILFAGVTIYSLYQAPDILWKLDPFWLLLSTLFILVMLFVEILQFFVFLHHHHKRSEFVTPMQFSVRKAIINAVFPAKTGTVFFLHMITENYQLEWHNYIRFMIAATVISLVISGLAAASILLPLSGFLIILALTILLSGILGRLLKQSYFRQTPFLLLVGSGLYVCRIFIFWSLLMAMGINATLGNASYFAIATNTLAQIPITPGNIGVREVIFGLMAPYLSLPMSTGVLVGAIFQILRIIVYFIVMILSELFFGKKTLKVSVDS